MSTLAPPRPSTHHAPVSTPTGTPPTEPSNAPTGPRRGPDDPPAPRALGLPQMTGADVQVPPVAGTAAAAGQRWGAPGPGALALAPAVPMAPAPADPARTTRASTPRTGPSSPPFAAPRHAGRVRAPGGLPPIPGTDPEAPLPDPTAVCCSVVRAAVEALRGTRPLAQLTRWVSPEVFQALAHRTGLTLRARQASGAPRSATVPPATVRPVTVLRARLCRIGYAVAEASVVVDDGQRVRAVAVRLEARRGSWRVTVLDIG